MNGRNRNDDDYVIYATDKAKLASIQKEKPIMQCEIWNCLPPFGFVEVREGTNKGALRAEGKNLYVWIPPSTADALKHRPLLRAIGYRWNGFIKFFLVEAIPAGTYGEEYLAEVQGFNEEHLLRAERESQSEQ